MLALVCVLAASAEGMLETGLVVLLASGVGVTVALLLVARQVLEARRKLELRIKWSWRQRLYSAGVFCAVIGAAAGTGVEV